MSTGQMPDPPDVDLGRVALQIDRQRVVSFDMQPAPLDYGSMGIPLAKLVREPSFAAAYFVLYGPLPHPLRTPFQTRGVADDLDDPTAETSTHKARAVSRKISVFPIYRRPHSDVTFATVGRLDGCDICLGDATVSKLHALIADDEAGRLFVYDANSRNGTSVDGVVAPLRGARSLLLYNGSEIRFGSVPTTFVDTTAMTQLAPVLLGMQRGTAHP